MTKECVVSFFRFAEGVTQEQIDNLFAELYVEHEDMIDSAQHNTMKNEDVWLENYNEFHERNQPSPGSGRDE